MRPARAWLRAQTSAKKIPFLKPGGRLRFRRADVERWIEGQVVELVRVDVSQYTYEHPA
ncbi:MAG: helix-turn-helix domain-containing protein [Candidatus Tectomicrobia bacterium]|nr:helix-turn-helix domain-containing protein [Candidatus Tectomicrobia bacterium]MBI3026132.1 helix-turn-helix domain-containing protein [Candidatus Tectomicrobia bacterium]